MKLTLAILLSLALPLTSIAGEWSDLGKITLVYPKPSRNGIYFKHDNMVSDGCSEKSYLFLDANQALFKESYSLLLAAYSSGKNVRIYVEGCQPAHNYPLIKEIVAE